MDLLQTTTDRFADENTAQRIGLVTVFNLQILFMSVCSRFIADLVRSNNVFTDIYWRGRIKDERDATRTSRMGLGTIKTLTDELQMRYRRATDSKVRTDFTENPTVLISITS